MRASVVDCDSHVSEPPDLWTSRLPRKFQAGAPHLEPHPDTSELRWIVDGQDLSGIGTYAHAGWKQYWPSYPPSLDDMEPATYDPAARVARLDADGIDQQLIFPNILGFSVHAFLALQDVGLANACVRAYNDYLTDFCSVAPDRLIPQMYLPFWDVGESVAELERCLALGHKSVVFSTEMEKVGLPRVRDPYWQPVLARAEEAGLPLTFHIGFANIAEQDQAAARNLRDMRDFAKTTAMYMLGNAAGIAEVLMSGLCEQYPQLKFVSIESGFGYIPFFLESLDWQFVNLGGREQFRDSLLPSEYFRRQVYASFWFETQLGRTVDLYPDNAMFSSDYPQPTSLSPGPGSFARNARDTIAANLASLPADLYEKVVGGNARRVYGLA